MGLGAVYCWIDSVHNRAYDRGVISIPLYSEVVLVCSCGTKSLSLEKVLTSRRLLMIRSQHSEGIYIYTLCSEGTVYNDGVLICKVP